jgi:hypothetical protein
MNKEKSRSDQLEQGLIEFAAGIIRFAAELPRNAPGRHIAQQILRSGTAAAPNYAEARGTESRADFVHKLGIVQKELNETAEWTFSDEFPAGYSLTRCSPALVSASPGGSSMHQSQPWSEAV